MPSRFKITGDVEQLLDDLPSIGPTTPEESESVTRQVVNQLNSTANKRIRRNLDAGLDGVPAMRGWQESGGELFRLSQSDSPEEVLRKYKKVDSFLKNPTSTVTGATSWLNRIGDMLGLEQINRNTIQEQSSRIFEVTSKIDQYLKTSGEGYAIGYDLLRYVTEYTQQDGMQELGVNEIVELLSQEDIYGDVQQQMQQYIYESGNIEGELGEWSDLL